MKLVQYLWLYFWIVPHVILLAIAVVMFVRGLHKEFPVFFSYLLFEFVQFCVLFALYLERAQSPIYLKIDLFGRAGSIALRFGIIQELFEAAVAHSAPVRKVMAPLLNCAIAVLVLLALAFIGSLDYRIVGYWGLKTYFTIEALNMAQCGLLALVFLWHGFLGLRMSAPTFGIVVGLGMAMGSEPLFHVLKDSASPQNRKIVDILSMATYHVAVLIWLYFASVREKATSRDSTNLLAVQRWAADVGRMAQL